MELKLLPCPFCGSTAYIREIKDRLKGDGFIATCKRTSCIGRNYKKWPSARAAAKAWNADDPDVVGNAFRDHVTRAKTEV